MKNILLIEDEENLNRGISLKLKKEGYAVFSAACVSEGLKLFQDNTIDLVICDIGLPDGSGLDLCANIRQRSDVLFLFLTALDTEVDVITGYEMGADDYVTKPFNPVELIARVKSQIRRYMTLGGGNIEKDCLKNGGIELTNATKEVRLDGEKVNLTPTEFDILKFLMEHVGNVYSPRDIYEAVWHETPYGSESAVAVHIRHLREKIEIDPGNPRYIKVIWGQGYKLEKQ